MVCAGVGGGDGPGCGGVWWGWFSGGVAGGGGAGVVGGFVVWGVAFAFAGWFAGESESLAGGF